MRKLLLLPLLVPTALAAQVTTVSPYVAADAGVSGAPVLVGVAVGREMGPLGLRWGSAVDARTAFSSGEREPVSGVAGLVVSEVDAMLVPFRASAAFPVVPYAFAGAGLRAVRDQTATSTGALWSYGGGMRAPLLGWLAVEGEARLRQPLGSEPEEMPALTSPGWEFRAGLSMRFGGRRGARPVPRSIPSRFPVALPAEGSSASAASRQRLAVQVLDTADDYLGVHYTWGGDTPASGFDCSGFVRYVFLRHGVELPRVSRDQATAGTPLPLDPRAFEPGDLLAFASDGREVDHIAIYAGRGRIIHSSSSGRGVAYDHLYSGRGEWYLRHMVAARRVIGPQHVWSTH